MYWEIWTEALPHAYPVGQGTDILLYRIARGEVQLSDQPDLHVRWTIDAAEVTDWPRAIGSRLVSNRAREVLQANLGQRDRIEWVPSTVVTTNGVEHEFWVPVFFPWMDVEPLLHPEHTTRGPGGLIRWVLQEDRLPGHEVFAVEPLGSEVVVSSRVRAELEKAGITGPSYHKARTAPAAS